MALLVLTWNHPPASGMPAYVEQAKSKWIPSVLTQPGVSEIRAYRNGSETKPDVMTTVEFENIQAVEAYMGSKQYSTVIAGLRSVGCTQITAQLWNPSPIVPTPLRPGNRNEAGAPSTISNPYIVAAGQT